ncbi:MAG: hypothetical protein HY791_34825 [Deltaproteobacteria bacterium]|nr:hypothetical protein [Deltaproteobacteria bacterium]
MSLSKLNAATVAAANNARNANAIDQRTYNAVTDGSISAADKKLVEARLSELFSQNGNGGELVQNLYDCMSAQYAEQTKASTGILDRIIQSLPRFP